MDFTEKKIKSNKVYTCSFIDVVEDDVLLPNNKKSKRVVVKHIGAAAVLPILPSDKILLIKQFRYAINQISLEIPAGKKDSKDESGIACVTRELEEETSYQSNNYQKILDFHTAIGFSDEMIEIFVATDLYEVKNPLPKDDDEFIEIVEYSLKDCLKMIEVGQITDSKTIAAIQYHALSKLS